MKSQPLSEEAMLKGDWQTVVIRLLCLCGLYMLLHQILFLIGSFGLTEKWMLGTPWFRLGEWGAAGGRGVGN